MSDFDPKTDSPEGLPVKMSRGKVPGLILALALFALAACGPTQTPLVPLPTARPSPVAAASPMRSALPPLTPTLTLTPSVSPLRLFETPRDGPAPVLTAIKGATRAVDVEVYELTDAGVIDALAADQKAGKAVRVILNQTFPTGGNIDAKTFQQLQRAGVAVKWAASAFRFTHAKSVVIDAGQPSQKALIMTLNLSPGYLGGNDPLSHALKGVESLNFGVVDLSPADVAQVEALFEADWNSQPYAPPADTSLVVSPANARRALTDEIEHAQRSIHFFAQEFEDRRIVNAMAAAAKRGVEVKGLLAPNIKGNLTSAETVRAAGGQIRFLAKPYEHAKATIVDGLRVYIGSINYTATSLDQNRELGILTGQNDIASEMETEFARFWKQGSATP